MSSIELETSGMSTLHYSLLLDEENGIIRESHQSLLALVDINDEERLIHVCERNWVVKLFLRATCNYWPSHESSWSWESIDKTMFALARLVNIGSVLLFCMNSLGAFMEHYLIDGAILFAVFVRTVSTMPVQYFNQQRLLKPVQSQESFVLEESAIVASIYGIIVLFTNVLSTTYIVMAGIGPTCVLYATTEHFLGVYLTFNVFFLVLDIKASSLMLDELHLLADRKKLAMDKFVSVRTEIHRRVKESRWASDLIIVPCIASIAIIFVLILYILDRESSRAGLYSDIGFTCFMLKELLFVVVAFVYVAKVNARADELTLKLSKGVWCEEDKESNVHSAGSGQKNSSQDCVQVSHLTIGTDSAAVELSNDTEHASDLQRMSICISSMLEPISFTLLFKRVSWRNVAISAGGFFVAILIAIIKNAVEADVNK